jgi:hypothetical protein
VIVDAGLRIEPTPAEKWKTIAEERKRKSIGRASKEVGMRWWRPFFFANALLSSASAAALADKRVALVIGNSESIAIDGAGANRPFKF